MHLLCFVHVDQYVDPIGATDDPDALIQPAIKGTLAALQAATDAGAEVFVMTSSTASVAPSKVRHLNLLLLPTSSSSSSSSASSPSSSSSFLASASTFFASFLDFNIHILGSGTHNTFFILANRAVLCTIRVCPYTHSKGKVPRVQRRCRVRSVHRRGLQRRCDGDVRHVRKEQKY